MIVHSFSKARSALETSLRCLSGSSWDMSAVVVERLLVPPGTFTVEGLHRLAGRMVRPVEEYQVGHTQRWPLGTAYPDIVNDVGRLTCRPPLSTDGLLVVDRAGVGTAVMDMFREAWRDGRLAGAHQSIGSPSRVASTATAGTYRRPT